MVFPPFSLSPYLPFLLRESNGVQSTKLKLYPKSLISLTINLINPVDKSVDKLWISCG
jgi:phosphoribosyl-dephospho-CoA transferase